MAATKEDIRRWLQRGHIKRATHVVVICDTLEYEDFPLLVMPGEDPRKIVKDRDGINMERVMEVYNLALDDEEQIAQRRVFNY